MVIFGKFDHLQKMKKDIAEFFMFTQLTETVVPYVTVTNDGRKT